MALFLGLGGVGYAAATIGSAQIKNNSIRSVDIKGKEVKNADLANNAVTSAKVKDGVLLAKDFKASERAALRGPAGANGANGAPGAPGAKGDAGPAGVVKPLVDAPGSTNPPGDGDAVQVAGLVLTPGTTYLISAKVQLQSIPAVADLECNLLDNNTGIDSSDWSSTGVNSRTTVPLQAARTIVGGPLRIRCNHDSPADPGGSASAVKLSPGAR